MQTAPSINPDHSPTARLYVAEQDLALFAALIGRKPMSKTLRESISDVPVMMTPVAAPAEHLPSDRRHRVSVWLHQVSEDAKKRLSEARSRLGA